MNKHTLNFLFKSQSSFIYVKVFNYDSFNLNQILLIRSRNLDLNPGPKKSSSLTFFHRNLNGIAARDSAKISLIQSYAMSYNTDVIFLFETFSDSSTEAGDPKINIPGHNSLCSDRLSNTKRGGVYVL